jgi:DNA helicase-2/ATP-dependent DNA helicase PcrA
VLTYHADAARLLREHGLRIGVEPDAWLLADATRYQLAARVIRRARGPFRELTSPVSYLVGDLLALDAELAEHLVEPERLREFDGRCWPSRRPAGERQGRRRAAAALASDGVHPAGWRLPR